MSINNKETVNIQYQLFTVTKERDLNKLNKVTIMFHKHLYDYQLTGPEVSVLFIPNYY